MVFCLFCQTYLGLLSFERYCENCSKIRRICLIVGTDDFLLKTKEIFLKDNICSEIKLESKNEFKQCIQSVEKEETKSKKSYDLDKDFPKLKRV